MNIPLTRRFYEIADQYAQEQRDQNRKEQGDRVRLNTLAVLAVRFYLQFHHIDTDVACGDAWNPAIRSIEDVADLPITGMGLLECRPILPGQDTIELPLETWSDRMGYVLVEIDEPNHMARLLRFAEPVWDLDQASVTLSRDQGRSLDNLHDFLERRQLVKQQIDEAYSDIKSAVSQDVNEYEQLTTEFTWITMRDDPSQWARKGIRAVDRRCQESGERAIREPGMLKEAQTPEPDTVRDRVRDLFQHIDEVINPLEA
jgi:hypothetical protein